MSREKQKELRPLKEKRKSIGVPETTGASGNSCHSRCSFKLHTRLCQIFYILTSNACSNMARRTIIVWLKKLLPTSHSSYGAELCGSTVLWLAWVHTYRENGIGLANSAKQRHRSLTSCSSALGRASTACLLSLMTNEAGCQSPSGLD